MKAYVLWGAHPRYAGGTPIKLTGGGSRHCRSVERSRERDGGWLLAVYAPGVEPVGLRLLAKAGAVSATAVRSAGD